MSAAVAQPVEPVRAEAPSAFNQSLIEGMKRITYRVPQTQKERDAIGRLRHTCYVREGAIDPKPSGILWDDLDDAPNCAVLGVFLDGRLVASMRSHRVTVGAPSPAMQIYADCLEPHIAAGTIVSDPTRFVVDADVSRDHPVVTYATARIGWITSRHFGARFGIATVRREHKAFYKRLLGFADIAGPRRYPLLKSDIYLVGRDYDGVVSHITQRYPFMLVSDAELEQIFGEAPAALEVA
jgi:hypothetical protein